jgi:hypothetical protein
LPHIRILLFLLRIKIKLQPYIRLLNSDILYSNLQVKFDYHDGSEYGITI